MIDTSHSRRCGRSALLGQPVYWPLMNHRAIKTVVYFLLGLAAAVSLIQGVRNALRASADLQWTDVVLLRHHQDPYEVYLSGDPKHQLMQWQIPNYLHEMYVVELPLAWVSFPTAERIWVAVNLLLLAASLAMLVRIYGLRRNQTLLYIALVLCSTGFRNTLGLGQQSFFALFCFVVSLRAISPFRRSLGLGGLYAKYSFAPAVVGYLLARREFRISPAFSAAPRRRLRHPACVRGRTTPLASA